MQSPHLLTQFPHLNFLRRCAFVSKRVIFLLVILVILLGKSLIRLGKVDCVFPHSSTQKSRCWCELVERKLPLHMEPNVPRSALVYVGKQRVATQHRRCHANRSRSAERVNHHEWILRKTITLSISKAKSPALYTYSCVPALRLLCRTCASVPPAL
jgi:hypothetical protein